MIKSTILVTVACLIAFQSLSAGNGKAILPLFMSVRTNNTTYHQSEYFISNLTPSPVTVKIKLYGHDGLLITDSGNSSASGEIQGTNLDYDSAYTENEPDYSVCFKLDGHNTGNFRIDLNQYDFGYGSIEWVQAGEASVALIATGRQNHSATVGNGKTLESMLIPINNGKPF